jgi:thymidylate kinase
VKIVSFSGIDGAGKSTQIAEFERWLHESGLDTRVLTFWDDVVVFSRWREFMSYKAFKGERGVGSPEKPVQRRDKNVTALPVTIARLFFYLVDTLNLNRRVVRARRSNQDVVIFDRYIYDELANLPLQRPWARAFARVILHIAPKPDVALLIDADPIAAHARKPEYPLEFVRRNRQAYITLAELAGNISLVNPGTLSEMKTKIREEMLEKSPFEKPSNDKSNPDCSPSRVDPSSVDPAANISSFEIIES